LPRVTRPLSGLTVPVLAVPVATALILAAGGVQPSYAAEPTPTAETSRAGSRVGEGRERPGRAGVEAEAGEVGTGDVEATDPTAAESTTSPDPTETNDPGAATDQEALTQPDAVDEPVLRALPLGSGLILIGLGLGLAFIALRIRRA
jgi:hypothetical protein